MLQKRLLSRIQKGDDREGAVTLDSYLEDIFANIERLLNSRQGSAYIAKDYGMPDFNSLIQERDNALSAIETEIKDMLLKYETRVHIEHIKGITNPQQFPGEINLDVKAHVPYEGKAHYIEYQTIITSSGKTMVRR